MTSSKVGIPSFGIMVLVAVLLASAFSGCSGTKDQENEKTPESMPKVLVQLEFSTFPKKYTCDGKDVSPEIKVIGVAENAKSIALIMDDPDAPVGTFTHWIIWNIPASKEVVIPEAFPTYAVVKTPLRAIQGVNDFKKIGYGGPCPPPGKPHRYFFRVYVLDSELELKPGSNRNELENAMEGKIIQYGEAMATYGK